MGAFGGFRVGVTVFLADRVSMGLLGISRSIATATGASRALRSELAGIQTAMRVGTGMTLLGAAGLGAIGEMAKSAAEFQVNMVRVTNMFALSTEQARRFKNEIFEISHATMFDADKIQDVALGMKQVGLNFQSITQLLPQFSAAAEILFRVGGVAPQQTGQVMGEFAHTLGVYDPKGLSRLGQVLVNAAQLIPGGPQSLVTQLGYLKPAQIMGTPPGNFNAEQREEFQIQTGIKMVQLAALAQQIVGSRGGSGARGPLSGPAMLNFILGAAGVGTTLTGFSFIQNQLGRAALGYLNPGTGRSTVLGKDGALDPFAEVRQAQEALKLASTLKGQNQMIRLMVQEMAQAHLTKRQVEGIMHNPMIAGPLVGQVQTPGAFVDLFAKMMGGQTGMRAFSALSSPGTITAMDNLVKNINQGATIAQQQQKFLDTLPGRWAQLTTDIHNVAIEIGTTLLPTITKWVVAIDGLVNKIRTWIEAHPLATQRLTELTAALSGLLVVGGVVSIFSALLRTMKIMATLGGFVDAGVVANAVIGVVSALAAPELLIGAAAIAALIGSIAVARHFAPTVEDWWNKHFEKPLEKRFPALTPHTIPGSTPGTLPSIPDPIGDAVRRWWKTWGSATPEHKSPAALYGLRPGAGLTGVAAGGITIHDGAVRIEVHGDIAGDHTVEKLRRELHAALLSLGHGAGIYESPLVHGAASI